MLWPDQRQHVGMYVIYAPHSELRAILSSSGGKTGNSSKEDSEAGSSGRTFPAEGRIIIFAIQIGGHWPIFFLIFFL
jgi:hypothetical protein